MSMHLREVKVRNFGPYYGEQELAFGEERPIVLVHGENMRGKTSLLNSVRWAPYGRALDRVGAPARAGERPAPAPPVPTPRGALPAATPSTASGARCHLNPSSIGTPRDRAT